MCCTKMTGLLPMACVAGLLFAAAPMIAAVQSAEDVRPTGSVMALAADVESTDGEIDDVNDDSFVLEQADGDEKTFKIDEHTVYTLEGKAASKDDVLKEGTKVAVTHRGNKALTVTAED